MNLIKQLLLFKNYLLGRYSTRSYSQEGEDLILGRIFEGQSTGTYVDVGAHHPLRFSNTYLLYRRGWSGLNIDATPGSKHAFDLLRPRDMTIELGVSDRRSSAIFYTFNEPAINTFDSKIAQHNQDVGYNLINKQKVELYPLSTILHKYLANQKRIDLMSIDVEGLDLQVLTSMDWRYRPKAIIVEALDSDLKSIHRSPIYQIMKSHSYRLFAKTANSLIFLPL